jgi:hypothetical protein
MSFSLPENFATNTNELVTLFRDHEASTNNSEKDFILRKALVSSCHLLGSIDLSNLSSRIREIYTEVQEYEKSAIQTMTWSEAMFGSESHFDSFLKNIEDGILKCTGIEEQNRAHILREIANLRQLARTEGRKVTAYRIISSIQSLQQDICQLKDQVLVRSQRRTARNKVLKGTLVTVVVTNAVGSVVFPQASPAALAASVTIGGLALIL